MYKRQELTNVPFTPQWPGCLDRNRRIIDQVAEKEVLLSYPYESMDAFVQLLREAANDPTVISIKITLYRLASQSHLAEALIAAAENGKEVTARFELRARFDESNNIEWSQRFEQAGCNVIYGFRDFKVHSKICLSLIHISLPPRARPQPRRVPPRGCSPRPRSSRVPPSAGPNVAEQHRAPLRPRLLPGGAAARA